MTVQSERGSHILSQDVSIPVGATVQFNAVVYQNSDAPFATPASLDYLVSPNQQARIDIMTTGSALTDVDSGVLLNIYQTKIGDATISGYNDVSADLCAFAGQVALRPARCSRARLGEHLDEHAAGGLKKILDIRHATGRSSSYTD